MARDPRHARRRREERRHDPHRGGLPGAVSAEEADHLAVSHMEGDTVDGPHGPPAARAIFLHEIADLDHRRPRAAREWLTAP
jgi:hypothetical protein